MVATKLKTADDLLAMGSDAPYELIDGELIEVSPTSFESSFVTARLSSFLVQHVSLHKLGWVTSAEGGFVLKRNPDTVVAPDIGFIKLDRFPAGQSLKRFMSVPPDLAVEVISPSNSASGIARKVSLYLDSGVSQIWIVHPEERSVTVHQSGEPPRRFRSGEYLEGGPVLPGLLIQISDIFANPLDE